MERPEELWNRWVDDAFESEAQAEDCRRAARENPDLARQKALAQRLGADLRAAHLLGEDPPYPDFFNHRLRRHLEGELAEQRPSSAPAMADSFWQRWFRAPRLAVAAAAAILVLAVLQTLVTREMHSATVVVHTYSPQPGLRIESGFSRAANATVLRIEGAPELPEEFELAASQASPRPGLAPPGPRSPGQTRSTLVPVHLVTARSPRH